MDIKKLNIVEGSVITISGDTDCESIKAVGSELRKRGLKDVLVVFLPDGQSIEVLDEKAMSEAGWVRSDATNQPPCQQKPLQKSPTAPR